MWLVVRGAMTPRIRRLHRTYYLPSMTGIATAIYEDVDAVRDEAAIARTREEVARQLAGVEKLPGTYPFDFARSVKAYRLNDFLHRLDRARASRGVFWTIPKRRSRRPRSRPRSAISCAAATGAA
jgi:hypothetical protein